MKKYAETKDYVLYQSDMNNMEEDIAQNSVDAIITDPPYGLTSIVKRFGKEGSAPAQFGKDGAFSRLSKGFMGKEWDGSGVEYSVEAWKHCYNVLKPGGYLLAFGGSRTFHRIACAIEDAGFEIRDTIMWMYGSGFPKSMNLGLAIDKRNGVESEIIGHNKTSVPDLQDVGKKQKEVLGLDKMSFGQIENASRKFTEIKKARNEWNGWGSCLKPAYEPIIVARKPFKGSLIDNVLENGVGGFNIDECRIPLNGESIAKNVAFKEEKQSDGWGTKKCITELDDQTGRFPANVILTYDEEDFEEVCGGLPVGGKNGSISKKYKMNNQVYGEYGSCNTWDAYDDSGSAARYFYCAKASKKDRDEGLEKFETKTKVFNGKSDSSSEDMKDVEKRFTTNGKNIHPTVKPVELMQYLIRLVAPKGATIMDCFMGSGSTGKAVMFENRERDANYKFIGIEMTEEYLPICEARIDYALNKYEYDTKSIEQPTNEEDFNLFTIMGGEENV